MSDYYLGIDIGASSGRHILASLKDGKIEIEEVCRFQNGMTEKNGEKIWDVDYLFNEILEGLKKCKEIGKIPKSVGIDTWGVDFVLLDDNDNRLGNAVAYRDQRTSGCDDELSKVILQKELYRRTGIQKQIFNTIYQLEALKLKKPELLDKADSMLMIPDYFNFLLTGVKKQEYTNATTGQLVNPDTKDWDYELIEKCGFPKRIFKEIVTPGTYIGNFKKEIASIVGFDAKVVVPATHDTGSAVISVPSNDENVLYISSGTWSLMGTECSFANTSTKAFECNFTNEGGYDYRFRFLKNIMGLWMIQSVKKEIGDDLSFAKICEGAKMAACDSIVDCNDERFLSPVNMTAEIIKYCMETNQKVPNGIFETARVIYRSLAKCYAGTVKEIEEITGRKFESVNVVGGGSNADYLNELTSIETGLKVYYGPTEATAIGNVVVQMIYDKKISSLKEARNIIFDSFQVKLTEV